MKNDNVLILGAVALAGLGLYLMWAGGAGGGGTTALWKVGDKLHIYAMGPSGPFFEAFVQVTSVRWNNSYQGWEYRLYDLCTSMSYGDYYLEIQLVEWNAHPVQPTDTCPA